ncbi:MAG TPA: aminotransferase class V-fold PLP-dependent enzyme [Terriglobales bacterium]|nr:aminotransferase class V-fold PLP-dependent enzyme [Terriglobales bacterium]
MRLGSNWNRRSFLGSLGVVAGALAAPLKFAVGKTTPSITGFGSSGNPYDELGVKTVINCVGTMTVLGGSIIRPELETVMAQAGKHFVRIADLEAAAGKKIAEMLKLPADYTVLVTSGAAAAIQSGLAGILTGDNEEFIRQIPDLTGMKSEVIIQKSHRNPFDHQLRNTGIKLVVIETREELLAAINEKTAMMHFSNFANNEGRIKVDEWIKIGKEHNIPCMNDAAADTPPVSHLWDYANMGYDLSTFSGGKAMRGPQCAGLLIGKKQLVTNAYLNNSPNEDTIGRSQKVGKEEIIGMIKAVELYLKDDHEGLNKEWQNRLEYISNRITKMPGVATSYFMPDIANHVPHMSITWDSRVKITPKEVSEALKNGEPSIIIGGGEGRPGLSIASFMLQEGEHKIVAEQLEKVLKQHA